MENKNAASFFYQAARMKSFQVEQALFEVALCVTHVVLFEFQLRNGSSVYQIKNRSFYDLLDTGRIFLKCTNFFYYIDLRS